MKYYFLEVMGDLDDGALLILDENPAGIGVKYCFLMHGTELGNDFPENAVIPMSGDREGTKLSHLIGNTSSFLIVHQDMRKVIETELNEKAEYFPFTILDHNGLEYSKDYCIINPLGARDCLDYKRSDIDYYKGNKDKVIGVNRYVIETTKLVDEPALFRIKENPTEYVISEDLYMKFQEEGFTNVVVREIEVSDKINMKMEKRGQNNCF